MVQQSSSSGEFVVAVLLFREMIAYHLYCISRVLMQVLNQPHHIFSRLDRVFDFVH